jgi:hypothetical protein
MTATGTGRSGSGRHRPDPRSQARRPKALLRAGLCRLAYARAVREHAEVVFLLTDIVGSSARWEQDEESMGKLVERHDELIEAAVIDAGGTLVKHRGEGDSTFSVFSSAGDAMRAALLAQRELRMLDVSVRMAVHAGAVQARAGDFARCKRCCSSPASAIRAHAPKPKQSWKRITPRRAGPTSSPRRSSAADPSSIGAGRARSKAALTHPPPPDTAPAQERLHPASVLSTCEGAGG